MIEMVQLARQALITATQRYPPHSFHSLTLVDDYGRHQTVTVPESHGPDLVVEVSRVVLESRPDWLELSADLAWRATSALVDNSKD